MCKYKFIMKCMRQGEEPGADNVVPPVMSHLWNAKAQL